MSFISARLSFLWRSAKKPVWGLVQALWAIVSNGDTLRGLLPSSVSDKLPGWPHWHWYVWFIGFLVILLATVVDAAYRRVVIAEGESKTAAEREKELEQRLYRKRHYMDEGEPAFENAMAVMSAFKTWREQLPGDRAAMLLMTADDDSQAKRLMFAFMGPAVRGGGMGNGNLQNLGIKPEHTEDIEQASSIDGTLVVHALPDVPGVLQLMDAIQSRVVQIKRVYTLPAAPQPSHLNVLWFHFSKGVRWSSEYWDEEKAKSQHPR